MDGFFKKLIGSLFFLKNILKKTSDVQPHKKALGKKGEVVGCEISEKKGYKILQRNYRRKTGEIDIICYDRGSIVFVEVKTRGSDSYGPPELAVTEAKKKQIIKMASRYIAEKKVEGIDLRFDVVSVFYPPAKKHPAITLYKNAFTKTCS
ncbi:YraN family protein [Candidatus Kuenenia stuttgartiensis]|uniref:YraN family protein n=1 Tax=Kuenenia stuttgartiensis TaxID=174633 RepID=UPI00146A4B06|nr:YraN family protein [Candidatus Kuenenia stuttgartiensis]